MVCQKYGVIICGKKLIYRCAVDSSASSTYQVVGPNDFNISYVDGSGALGDYFADTFEIGGKSLSAFEMGLGEDTTISIGIM